MVCKLTILCFNIRLTSNAVAKNNYISYTVNVTNTTFCKKTQHLKMIRLYKTSDQLALLKILRLNTPQFFAPSEEEDFIE